MLYLKQIGFIGNLKFLKVETFGMKIQKVENNKNEKNNKRLQVKLFEKYSMKIWKGEPNKNEKNKRLQNNDGENTDWYFIFKILICDNIWLYIVGPLRME